MILYFSLSTKILILHYSPHNNPIAQYDYFQQHLPEEEKFEEGAICIDKHIGICYTGLASQQ